jgi:hypothetical protein
VCFATAAASRRDRGRARYHLDMATIEVGIRVDMTQGVSFFGLEAVNKQLAAGLKIRELRPGALLTKQVNEDGGNVQLAIGGCQFIVVFEGD